MALTIFELGPSALEVIILGKLGKDDYRQLNRVVKERIEMHGEVEVFTLDAHETAREWVLAPG